MQTVEIWDLEHSTVEMTCTQAVTSPACVVAHLPSRGRKMEVPPRERISVPIYHCRPVATPMTLDDAGSQFVTHDTAFDDIFDPDRVRRQYSPEAGVPLKAETGTPEFICDQSA